MASSSRILIVHIQSKYAVTSYNIQTRQCHEHGGMRIVCEENEEFFRRFRSVFNNLKQVKAIVFSLKGVEFSTTQKQYEFLCECRKFCQQNGIFCYVPFLSQPSAAISLTKTMVKEGEKVMIFLMDFLEMPPLGTTLIRIKDCYQIINQHYPNYLPFTKEWEEDVMGTLKPKKIILMHGDTSNDLKKAQRFFKSYNFVVINQNDIRAHSMEAIVNKILFLMDRKVNQYDVANPGWCMYEVRFDGESLIKTAEFEQMPFEKSVVIPVKPTKRVSLFCNYGEYPPELFEEIKLSTFKCKKVTVTLKIDINSFYDLKVELFDGKELDEKMSKMNISDKAVDEKQESKEGVAAVEEMPVVAKCDASNDILNFEHPVLSVYLFCHRFLKNVLSQLTQVNLYFTFFSTPVVPEKARLVFDKQNFSVHIYAKQREYALKDAEGLEKIPIYIAFHQEKPVIGKAAVEVYAEKPKCVIFDLIKLCSITNADIESPKWGFNLSKEDSIIVTMETGDGEKKSTVDFLLALIIKNGNDRIKKKYGKKMKELEIGFDGFTPNEMLRKNFIEAGKLLEIGIVFV